MANSENLISLVFAKPELWDQSHVNYSSKNVKLRAWGHIAEKLGLTMDVAKGRWTNLRDLFRRELKKSLRFLAQDGDPDAYRPRWKHFRSMLFLKEQMVKDDPVHYEEHLYPQTVLEDGSFTKYDDDTTLDDLAVLSSPGSTPVHQPDPSTSVSASTRSKRRRPSPDDPLPRPMRTNGEEFTDANYETGDEDYHFVMSLLPSIKRIRRDRKTAFRLKVLQLIAVEEQQLKEDSVKES